MRFTTRCGHGAVLDSQCCKTRFTNTDAAAASSILLSQLDASSHRLLVLLIFRWVGSARVALNCCVVCQIKHKAPISAAQL
jgi:hypothetical protein